MSNFRVFPIADSVAREIRETRADKFGHQLEISISTESDTGPCRSCLTVIRPGEGRYLFSYAPNEYDHPYNEVGPVFIHEHECTPYWTYREFPQELRTRRALVLRCYAADGQMIGGELVGERPVEEVIESLFDDSEVEYLHARTATVGCFIARIERPTP